MTKFRRGTIVGDASGALYVVWGVSGPVAHLLPGEPAPRFRLTSESGRAMAVDVRERRHLPVADLHVQGALSKSALDAIAEAIEAERVAEQHAAADRVERNARRCRARRDLKRAA